MAVLHYAACGSCPEREGSRLLLPRSSSFIITTTNYHQLRCLINRFPHYLCTYTLNPVVQYYSSLVLQLTRATFSTYCTRTRWQAHRNNIDHLAGYQSINSAQATFFTSPLTTTLLWDPCTNTGQRYLRQSSSQSEVGTQQRALQHVRISFDHLEGWD